MKVWLTLQEGPGASPSATIRAQSGQPRIDVAGGRQPERPLYPQTAPAGVVPPSYLLDPFKQSVLSMGRGTQCDVVVQDSRASRHHSDIRWNGRQWEIMDRGSTNGTYINGVQIHSPHELRLGDRITIGDTTMVLHEFGATPDQLQTARDLAGAARGAYARPQPVEARRRGVSTGGATVGFWLAQVLVAVAVVCLAAGAFLPWFRVSGSLSRDMAPILQDITDIVSSFVGEDLLSITQDISGLGGFGRVSLGLAVVCAILLIVDVAGTSSGFLTRRSVVAGTIYLVTSLIAVAVIAAELKNAYDLYDQVQSMTLLLGIRLADVVEAFGDFIDLKVTFLPGLYLTVAGLLGLLAGGVVRVAVAILGWRAER
jgi:hypothetical protein